jgi:hypothetical protein
MSCIRSEYLGEYGDLQTKVSWSTVFGGARIPVETNDAAYYSLGRSMRPNIVIKNKKVVRKIPRMVGRPDGATMVTIFPRNCCRITMVSGLANRKKTSAL